MCPGQLRRDDQEEGNCSAVHRLLTIPTPSRAQISASRPDSGRVIVNWTVWLVMEGNAHRVEWADAGDRGIPRQGGFVKPVDFRMRNNTGSMIVPPDTIVEA